jgi:hypothetical protein
MYALFLAASFLHTLAHRADLAPTWEGSNGSMDGGWIVVILQ